MCARKSYLIATLLVVTIAAVACAPPTLPTVPTRIPPTATTAPTLTPVPPTAVPTASPVPVGVVYLFFSTMCQACDEQAIVVEQFHQDNSHVMVVGAPLYPQFATPELVQAFASRNNVTFPVREESELVNALGQVRRHPVIAFQSALGGPLVKASEGVISEQGLTESFQGFITGGSVTLRSGPG